MPRSHGELDVATRLVCALGERGDSLRHFAVGLDLLRSAGVRTALRRLQNKSRRKKLAAEGSSADEMIWRDAAERLGAEVIELSPGFLEIRKNGASTRVWNHTLTLDDAVTLELALDKVLGYELLSSAGLRIPEYCEFSGSRPQSAVSFMESRSGPFVVKPAGGRGGDGTTTSILSLSQFRRATLRARRHGDRLLIENQVPGDLYRLLFIEGHLLDVIRRRPPEVIGDGTSSIRELIDLENVRRCREVDLGRPSLLHVDLDCLFTLESRGLSLGDVPRAGEVVAVKTVINQNGPWGNETYRDEVAPSLIEAAKTAARVIGVRFAGVDVMTPDPSTDLERSGGALLEVNGTPGLAYHYQVRDPESATPVAVPILEELLS